MVDLWVVTPRHGKAVEINALWYNALCVLEKLSRLYGGGQSRPCPAELVQDSFLKQFWDEKGAAWMTWFLRRGWTPGSGPTSCWR